MSQQITLAQAINDWNIGQDGSNIQMTDTQGNAYNLGLVTLFHVTPKIKEVTLEPINYGGLDLTRTVRSGGTIDITIARSNGTLEDLEYALQQDQLNQVNERYFTIYQYIVNTDPTTALAASEYGFIRARCAESDFGEYSISKAVEQKLKFVYESWTVISA